MRLKNYFIISGIKSGDKVQVSIDAFEHPLKHERVEFEDERPDWA